MSKAARILTGPTAAGRKRELPDRCIGFEADSWSALLAPTVTPATTSIRSIRLTAFLQSDADQTSLPNRMTPMGGTPPQLRYI
jgi:hypothetical protein